jgi:addiction module HigA family antidote
MAIRVRPPVHPGEILREEYMLPLTLTGYALGKVLGVPRTRIERLAAEQTPVTPDTAIRLGRYFQTSPDFWMNLQTAYDLTIAEDAADPSAIDAIQPRDSEAA